MWKKILVQGVLLALMILAFFRLYLFAFNKDVIYAYTSMKEFAGFILIAVVLNYPVCYLYKRIFKKQIEKDQASLYSKSWFVRLVCGFVVILLDLFVICLFNGFEQTTFIAVLVIFVVSYGLFAIYAVILELITNILMVVEKSS